MLQVRRHGERTMKKYRCEICGYEGEMSVVNKQADGIYRCRLCRQRAEYGRTFHSDEKEWEAERRGERRKIKPIEKEHETN